ncbi:MAG: aminotransferase class V-fold PLP-dependent enzyme [Clostridiaceae bacterium]|nr:aminotransferase class V-fold PLP-dependent enzyme [Clostridiaceae bacterium]
MYRNLICGVDEKIPLKDGSLITSINFDNAATTPPLKTVLQEIMDFSPWYSSIHRGTGYKSMISSNLYEKSRSLIMDFVSAGKESVVIYVKNTTEAINKLSFRLCDGEKKCVILSTDMEHHSNDLPWRDKYVVDYINIKDDGSLSLEDLEKKLIYYKESVKLVTVTGASNVTGIINPIYKIARLCHSYKTKILIDGAQLVPHQVINMGENSSSEHIDFLVFSAHKMYAPFGIGVLIGPKEVFMKGRPDLSGGGTVNIVTHDHISWSEPPEKEEAGSPNVIGVAALAASIRTLQEIGLNNISNYEEYLTYYALDKLKEIPDIIIYGDVSYKSRVGIIPFNISGIPHDIVAQILSDEGGISLRNGCFCAQPYVQKLLKMPSETSKKFIENPLLPKPGMLRISFGFYNEIDEIDKLIYMLIKITMNKNKYINIYTH